MNNSNVVTDLCTILSWDNPAAVLAVALLSVVIAIFVLWWGRRRSEVALPPPVEDEVAPEETPEPEPEVPEESQPDGPGQLLVRFQLLGRDLEQTTRDLQRFNGTREVQLQGWQQVSSDIIRRILPVLDNLEPYLSDEDSPASDIAQLTYGRLMTELVTIGVSQIIPSPGEPFNGRYHQLNPESTGYPPFRIKSVVSPGYRFQPRINGATEIVLKPAEVIAESDVETPVQEDDDVVVLERIPAPMTEEV